MRTKIFCAAAIVLAACGGGGGASSGATSGGETVAGQPAGYHSVTPALTVTDIDQAVTQYEAAFGATRTERIEGPDGRPVHAEIRIGDSTIMLGAEEPEHGQRAPTSAGGSSGSLFVYVADVDAAMQRAIGAGATQITPPTDMFWGDRYGQVRDANGHRWSLATHRCELTMEQIGERAQAFMAATGSGQPPPAVDCPTAATSYRPAGYHDVTPVLVVSGPEAIDHYVRALGATERERALVPDGRMMHGEIQVGDSIVMLTDEFPEQEADSKTGTSLGAVTMTLMVYTPDVDAAYARATGAGATSVMPVGDMFWGDRFGTIRDGSGQIWGLATHVRDVSAEEMRAAMASMQGTQ
jgi:uncharacterized glyoxalase superfamily protein PhnB